jgi:predicted O-methyltransferase YrrM
MTTSSNPDGFTLGTTGGRVGTLDIKAPAAEIAVYCRSLWPGVDEVLAGARAAVPWCKREIWPHQAAVLAFLAHQVDREGARILEIGTALGYSAAVMALAAPRASVQTLNPKLAEFARAREHLRAFRNVLVSSLSSAETLEGYPGKPLDLVFVDGDHSLEGVRRDCGWWEHVRHGGLILFHDYSPAGSKRPNPEVVQAVDEFAARLGRRPDVLVVDEQSVGMAGFVRREADAL